MLNLRDIDNFARWQWMNDGMNKDFLAAFIATYPETKEAPTTYATLGQILEAIETGEMYARDVMLHQDRVKSQGARFRRLFRRHGITGKRYYLGA